MYNNVYMIKVDLRHLPQVQDGQPPVPDTQEMIEQAIDLKTFYISVEWDLMAVPAKKSDKCYPCCDEPYPEITYTITIRSDIII